MNDADALNSTTHEHKSQREFLFVIETLRRFFPLDEQQHSDASSEHLP